MEIKVIGSSSYKNSSDTKIVPAFDSEENLKDNSLGKEINKIIDNLRKQDDFTGKLGQVQSFRLNRTENPNKIIVLGHGKREELSLDRIRKIIGKAIEEAEKLRVKSIEIALQGEKDAGELTIEEKARVITETIILSKYKFDKYMSDAKQSTIKEINIVCDDEKLELVKKGSDEGRILGEATVHARDLVNEPANVMVPIELANRAELIGKESGFEVEIFDEIKINELGMKAFWEVAKASANPPRFIIMRYFGDKSNKNEVTGLVGKGLTYDSGGLSIKTKDGMLNMKCDMGGAAAVIGAMKAIAEAKLQVNVVAVVAACENMISGHGYRPGDIIDSMGGKSIFIKSTDAEGRLTLIDAVHYIIEHEGVNRVVDIATLTGAAGATLGNAASPVISNNDEFYDELEKASKITGEKIWRMPTFEEYKEQLKTKFADLTNSAGQPGMITAGLFIGEFVQDKPWVHIDIAPTAWSSKTSGYIKEGATGVGVRTLYYLVKK